LRNDVLVINPVMAKVSEMDCTQGFKILELMPDRSIPADDVISQCVKDQLAKNIFAHSGELNPDVSDFSCLHPDQITFHFIGHCERGLPSGLNLQAGQPQFL
jgi:hypothetical protein